ncbi:MAG: hypothetical protein OES38_02435, partial [Gammaproteobacteria bacterium]|nr:hypothetical protein [Gammaproteobacteria bacterium]
MNKSGTLLARGWLIALVAVVCAGGAYSETGASDTGASDAGAIDAGAIDAGAEGGKKLAARLQAL